MRLADPLSRGVLPSVCELSTPTMNSYKLSDEERKKEFLLPSLCFSSVLPIHTLQCMQRRLIFEFD